MRRTSGQLAFMAAVGGGFQPDVPRSLVIGEDQGDGTFRTGMTHYTDGRKLTITTKAGNGWQHGPLLRAVASGPWKPEAGVREVTTWRSVRELLAAHDPGREHMYNRGRPFRQPRPLDGRERDLVFRILSDIDRAIRAGKENDLLRLIWIDADEVFRIQEIKAVLDGRDD